MYRLLRNTHLVLGLSSAAFLLAYGLSAFEMAHPFLFGWSDVTTTTQTVDKTADTSPRAFAQTLMNRGLAGDLMEVASSSVGVEMKIVRPGTTHEVRYSLGATTATVVTTQADLVGTLNRLHHVTGVWHDDWVVDAWAWFMGVVSLMLFGIGLTGIVMWFKRKKERGWGIVTLALGGGVGGALVVLIRLLP